MFRRTAKRRKVKAPRRGFRLLFWRDPFWEPRVWFRRLVRITIMLALLIVAVPPAMVLLYRDVAPPGTLLMVLRLFEGEGIRKEWVPLERVSRHVPAAVIALEDNLFCEHDGFDWAAIFDAAADRVRGEDRLRGGSTISQQTAKNVFLWPGRNYVRKGLEVPFTTMMEWWWGKRRIMEVYLNVIEWGPGIYGVEAASQTYFGKPARRLSRREAALLAAVLPNPRRWSPARPTNYIKRKAGTATYRMSRLGTRVSCVR